MTAIEPIGPRRVEPPTRPTRLREREEEERERGGEEHEPREQEQDANEDDGPHVDVLA